MGRARDAPLRTRTPTPPVATSRVARTAARERRRRLTAGIAAAALIAAAAAWLLLPNGGSERGPSSAAPGDAATRGRPGTIAVQLTGAAEPLMAVVRTGGDDAPALTIPPDMALEVPGFGEATTATMAEQDPAAMRVSLSNTVGTWIDHYLVLGLDDIAAVADAAGGFRVTLPGTVRFGDRTVGPGTVTLTGEEIRRYLAIDGPNAFTRWEVVLPALLRARTGLTGESDDLEAVTRMLPVPGDVAIDTFPTRISASSARVPDRTTLGSVMASDFGVDEQPVRVVLQNGVGDPGLGADVAALLVPKGFSVVLAQNAPTFDVQRTKIIATGDDSIADADRARRLLGVGEVAVTPVPSGLTDITIVLGKDFTA